MNIEKLTASPYFGKIKGLADAAQQLRADKNNPVDTSFTEIVQETFECSVDALLESLGIDPNIDTISNILTVSDMDVKWIIPEIIRDAIYLGLRDAPIWPNLTASEQDINQQSVTMPFINMSDAVPHKVGEGETIPLGSISYGQKSVKTFKIGRGIKITYEIKQYVSLEVISIFFQDFGIKLGQALDTLAIDVLINGDQADGSESAPVLGIGTPNAKVYKDFLKVWIRASRMGRKFNTIIGSEESALETLDLSEFKDRKAGTTDAKLNLKTPVPNDANYYIHGNVPPNQEILVDPRYALIKYNVIPLMIESEKIISNQTEEFYASLTTGFGKIFRDSTMVLDSTKSFATFGFPEYMDVDAFQNVVFGE